MNRILVILLVVALVIGGYMLYQRHHPSTAYNGEIISGPGSDRSQTDTTDTQASLDEQTGGGAATNQPPPSMKAPIATETSGVARSSSAPPAADSIAPLPPNGVAFGGSGRYQWYREGDLTWRVDTSNGTSCIAFATLEQWRKPIVYTHGCGNA